MSTILLVIIFLLNSSHAQSDEDDIDMEPTFIDEDYGDIPVNDEQGENGENKQKLIYVTINVCPVFLEMNEAANQTMKENRTLISSEVAPNSTRHLSFWTRFRLRIEICHHEVYPFAQHFWKDYKIPKNNDAFVPRKKIKHTYNNITKVFTDKEYI